MHVLLFIVSNALFWPAAACSAALLEPSSYSGYVTTTAGAVTYMQQATCTSCDGSSGHPRMAAAELSHIRMHTAAAAKLLTQRW